MAVDRAATAPHIVYDRVPMSSNSTVGLGIATVDTVLRSGIVSTSYKKVLLRERGPDHQEERSQPPSVKVNTIAEVSVLDKSDEG
jgi:hypothetical protein